MDFYHIVDMDTHCGSLHPLFLHLNGEEQFFFFFLKTEGSFDDVLIPAGRQMKRQKAKESQSALGYKIISFHINKMYNGRNIARILVPGDITENLRKRDH